MAGTERTNPNRRQVANGASATASRMGDNVKKRITWAGASAAILLAFASGVGAANAADMSIPVKAAPVATGPASCTGLTDFFLSNCILSYYGVQVYGTVDVGGGYQTKGAPFDPNFVTGASYFLQKMNRQAMWGLAPNGMSQSNIGVRVKEPVYGGFSFIGNAETGFDPYSLKLANSPLAEFNNSQTPLLQQTTNGDSSRAGQWLNSQVYAGFSHPVYGTLTGGRVNALSTDANNAYDPMGGSYAFSPIGFSGTNAGAGNTESARYNTALKYRVDIANWRLAAAWQFGGYGQYNSSRGAYEAQVGADFKLGPGTLSTDAIYTNIKDDVYLTLNATATPGFPVGMQAQISNNQAVMLVGKYSFGSWASNASPLVGKAAPTSSGPTGIPLTLYGGWQWIQITAPSDPVLGTFTNIAGICQGFACGNGTSVLNTNFGGPNDTAKFLNFIWGGARYTVVKDVDVTGAYYHIIQNQYLITAAGCGANGFSGANSRCAGNTDAISGVVDWHFLPKWDTYLGTMFSQVNGGMSNGYAARNNIATTAGVRFRF